MTDPQLIRADDLARQLGIDPADLFERVILGDMPIPVWRRSEVVEWVAAYRGAMKGGSRNE